MTWQSRHSIVPVAASSGTGWRQNGQSAKSIGPNSGFSWSVGEVVMQAASTRSVPPRLSRPEPESPVRPRMAP